MGKIAPICIIQARMGSTRLPGKTLFEVDNKSLLAYQIDRIKQVKEIEKIVVATTSSSLDDKIEQFCQENNIGCFRGAKDDVLNRFYQCAQQYPDYNNIVRTTGDCPLIDPYVISQVIDFFTENNFDYASNVLEETYPDGMDVEVFTRQALFEAAKNAKLKSEREHVTLYIRNQEKFKKGSFKAPINYSNYRLTVDQIQDFEVIEFLIKNSKITDSYQTYIELLEKNPDVMKKNFSIARNQGLIKSLKNDKVIE